MTLESELRTYVADNLLYIDDGFEYDDDSSFIGEGLLDSLGISELTAYIQSAFGITLEQHEITPDNFDSINKLAAFIRRKQAGARPSGSTKDFGPEATVAAPAQ